MSTDVPNYEIEFPHFFHEYAAELESKSFFGGLPVVCGALRYELTLCDPTRLAQDIEEEFRLGARYFSAENIVVVPRVVEDEFRAVADRPGGIDGYSLQKTNAVAVPSLRPLVAAGGTSRAGRPI